MVEYGRVLKYLNVSKESPAFKKKLFNSFICSIPIFLMVIFSIVTCQTTYVISMIKFHCAINKNDLHSSARIESVIQDPCMSSTMKMYCTDFLLSIHFFLGFFVDDQLQGHLHNIVATQVESVWPHEVNSIWRR